MKLKLMNSSLALYAVASMVLALANPPAAAGQDGSPLKPEIDANLDCINNEVLWRQDSAGHQVDNASLVIQASYAVRS